MILRRLIFAFSLAAYAWGQAPLDVWINSAANRAVASEKTDKILAAADAGKDRAVSSAPSLDPSSSSIIDHSDPGEFFNAALNLAGMNGRPTATSPTGSFTVTMYSLVATLQHESLVNPELYRKNKYLRRVSFTLGAAASSLAVDGTETPGALYGVRWRLLQGADLFSKYKSVAGCPAAVGAQDAQQTFQSFIQQKLNEASSFDKIGTLMNNLSQNLKDAAGQRLFTNAQMVMPTVALYQQIYNASPPTTKARIDQLIQASLTEDAEITNIVQCLRKHMERPKQLAVAYFTNQRHDGGADDHRLEVIFDWGLHKQVDWTLNGSFEYRNVVNIGGDRKGGRLATEAKVKLFELSGPEDTAEKWISLNIGGEWKATTGAKPYLTAQIRLSIPLTGGVSLPIAWSYESRPFITPLVQANNTFSRFKFGIEFDPGKISGLAK